MESGKFSYSDIELLYKYLEKNCKGAYVRFAINHSGTLEIQTKTKFEEDVKITIFQEETKLFAKITKEERLTNE